MATPQAYPQGYAEDAAEASTKLGTVSISLLRFGAAEARITILCFWREFEPPVGEQIFWQV